MSEPNNTDALARMTALDDEMEQAMTEQPSERAAIEEAWNCPRCSGDCSSANPPVIFCPTEAFRRKLDAEAYIDAVIQLVPPGYEWRVGWAGNSDAAISLLPNGPAYSGYAETPALALLAAIRAHMEQRNDEHKEIQEKGAICRRIGAYKLDNPYLKIENMPGTTGEPFEDWQAKHDAWELGWVVQDMMI